MSLIIESQEAAQLAEELMEYTDERLADVVVAALRERLRQEKAKRRQEVELQEALLEIGRACAALPVQDARSAETILGYNDTGVPS
jgi:antitoxin VapB